MFIDRWMDKEDVVYIYTIEYYSVIKKEQNNAICSNMEATRDYHSRWSQKEKGK